MCECTFPRPGPPTASQDWLRGHFISRWNAEKSKPSCLVLSPSSSLCVKGSVKNNIIPLVGPRATSPVVHNEPCLGGAGSVAGPGFDRGSPLKVTAIAKRFPVISLLTALQFFWRIWNVDFYVKISHCFFFLSWQLIQTKNNSNTAD